MKERGLRLKELRKRHKDTLKELADKIDYDYSNLSKIERGIYKGTIDIFEKIASVYGVDVSYFTHIHTDLGIEEFTDAEKEIMFQRDLDVETLKSKYNLVVDGKQATNEEIEEMIKYIRAVRLMNQNTDSWFYVY